MRPCGPVRNYYRPTREITKKEVIELLEDKSYASIEVYENGEFVSEYTEPITKLKALLRKGITSVHTTNGYRFSKYRKDGFRTVVVEFDNNKQIVLIRKESIF